jgi:MYXO-CTERM domain-containing protein
MRRAIAVATTLALTTACASKEFESDEDQLRFVTPDVTAGHFASVDPRESPVLAGTTMCADITLLTVSGDLAVYDCFDASVSGPATLEGTCLTFEAPGEVRWSFDPHTLACEYGAGLVEDGVSFSVVAPDAVTARRSFPYEELVAAAVAREDDSERYWTTAEGGSVPADAVPLADEPLLWMQGGTADLSVMVEHEDVPVIWEEAEGRIDVRSDEEPDPFFEPNGTANVRVSPEERGTGEIVFAFGDNEWSLGTYEVVPRRAADSIEIVAFYSEGADHSGPLGARAVVRDADGRPIFGAPVEWGSADATLGISVAEPGTGDRSYAVLDAESCLLPSQQEGEHTTTLQARVGGLRAELDVDWTLPPLDVSDAELEEEDAAWERGELCLGPLSPIPGCGCATGAPGPAAGGAVLALISAAFRARRRPRS